MKLNLINSPLKADLELIEKELEKSIHSDIDLLQEASIQLLKAGGKRIRPISLFFSVRNLGPMIYIMLKTPLLR